MRLKRKKVRSKAKAVETILYVIVDIEQGLKMGRL